METHAVAQFAGQPQHGGPTAEIVTGTIGKPVRSGENSGVIKVNA